MTARSAGWRDTRDEIAKRVAEELGRPRGRPSKERARLSDWLADREMAEEDRITLTRMIMMTMSLPREVQPDYAADMISEIEGWDRPDAPVEMFRWFRKPSAWAKAQAEGVVSRELERGRPERPRAAE